MPAGDLTITDAKGLTRVISAEAFTKGRRQCDTCWIFIRHGETHRCPRDGSNRLLRYKGRQV